MTNDTYSCPKCNCSIIYWDAEIGKCACQKCGTRFPARIKDTLPEEEKEMALDKEKLKELYYLGKSDKDIATALNAKPGTVWAARKAMGLSANLTHKRSPKPKQEKTVDRKAPAKTDFIATSNVSALDMLINERNYLQERVFNLNKAIEILS
jgi:transcription initiation factor TFIIIB Brf1 subunit/transcription initiation factor TFIIB